MKDRLLSSIHKLHKRLGGAMTQVCVDAIERADDGDRVLRWFDNEVVADDGTLVARVRKQVYVRRARG